jgi:perosamine synthetase
MIPVYNQIFTDEDAKAVYNVVKSQFITQASPEVDKLEENFKKLTGRKHAISCSNGTTALHLALLSTNLGRKNIAIPACCFVAVAFAVEYIKANPIFIDADIDSWNMDLNILEQKCKSYKIDAVIAVHNYGNPIDMIGLIKLSNQYKFKIIEDGCEALTSYVAGKPVGSFGEVSVFSMYGNKLLSSGEGGMILTDDNKIADKCKLLRGQAQQPGKRFWHCDIGYNYRITGMQAALANSQINRIEETSNKLIQIAETYSDLLCKKFRIQKSFYGFGFRNSWWMFSIMNESDTDFYNTASKILNSLGYDSRPVFPPVPLMPPWSHFEFVENDFPIAVKLWKQGITLPGGPGLSISEVTKIAKALLFINKYWSIVIIKFSGF